MLFISAPYRRVFSVEYYYCCYCVLSYDPLACCTVISGTWKYEIPGQTSSRRIPSYSYEQISWVVPKKKKKSTSLVVHRLFTANLKRSILSATGGKNKQIPSACRVRKYFKNLSTSWPIAVYANLNSYTFSRFQRKQPTTVRTGNFQFARQIFMKGI